MSRLSSWTKCHTTESATSSWDPLYRACVFNKTRLIVAGISFAIWAVAVTQRITPIMAYPTLWLLSIVAAGALFSLPLYSLGTQKRLPRPWMLILMFVHSLSDLLIILSAIHFTGGLQSPGNMLLLTYLATVALTFPQPVVLLLAALSATGYLVLGFGYVYGWWRAYYSNGAPQPIPTYRQALLVTLSDLAFMILVSGIVLHLRHLLEQANQQLRRERNFLAHLRDVVHEGLHHHQVQRLAHYLVYHMSMLVEAKRGYLILWDEGRRSYHLVAATPKEALPPESAGTRHLEAWQEALVTQARTQGTLLQIPNGTPTSETPPFSTEHAALVIPITRADQTFFGAVLLLRESAFEADEVARARETTELLSLVLLRALAEEHLREEIQLLEGLSQWASDLMRQVDETALIQHIGEGARRLFHAPKGMLFLLNSPTGEIRPAYLYGIDDQLACYVTRHPHEFTDCQTLLHNETFFVAVEDAATASALPSAFQHLPSGAQSGVLVALQAPQRLQGILGIFWDHPFTLASEHRFVLRLIGAYAGAALYNARLMRHLHQEAHTDPLTDLPNRRAFEEMLQRETYRAQRYGHSYALMVLDLNDFKRINDTYGHLAGDRVLQQTASALHSALRESDFLARYGGDEFVVLLPETSAEQAQTVAHKLIKQMESLAFNDLPDDVRCGLSLGIATFPKDGTDPQRLLAIADERMYAHKAQQRDQRRDPPATKAG